MGRGGGGGGAGASVRIAAGTRSGSRGRQTAVGGRRGTVLGSPRRGVRRVRLTSGRTVTVPSSSLSRVGR